MQKHNTYHD